MREKAVEKRLALERERTKESNRDSKKCEFLLRCDSELICSPHQKCCGDAGWLLTAEWERSDGATGSQPSGDWGRTYEEWKGLCLGELSQRIPVKVCSEERLLETADTND